jgi:quercetin dioxygenase-like cupin family protein
VIAKSGESTLLLGGKMLNQKASAGQGEYTGTGIEGGERHAIAAGDIIQIPAKVPHSFLVAKGQHFTYVLLKIPAKP